MKNTSNKIMPVWQPQGYSTHIITKKISELYGVKTSHTGTLDPMAEGVIIVLLDDERLKKYEYAKWLKTYEFEVVLGIETDTYDGMGLIKNTNLDKTTILDEKHVTKVLKGFIGPYSQSVPPYSAIKVKGKPMHWWARNNKLDEVVIPERSGKILNIELVAIKDTTVKNLTEDLITKISRVNGDFRQKEIMEQWQYFTKHYGGLKISLLRINMQTTKGLYVRSYANDITKVLGEIGFCNNIVRNQNGIYSKKTASRYMI